MSETARDGIAVIGWGTGQWKRGGGGELSGYLSPVMGSGVLSGLERDDRKR